MKKLGLVLMVMLLGVGVFANPFRTESGGEAFSLMEGAVDEVVTEVLGLQGTITGAITGILPMLMGIFVVFLVIRFVPRLVSKFTRG